MSWLRTIWDEFIGLFVDDISFAVAIVVWLGLAFALFHLGLVPAVEGRSDAGGRRLRCGFK